MVTALKGENIQTCPICGETILKQLHWVQCPKYRQAVCMKHCYEECKHFRDERCRYRQENNKKTLCKYLP